jgi:hypothetical protein
VRTVDHEVRSSFVGRRVDFVDGAVERLPVREASVGFDRERIAIGSPTPTAARTMPIASAAVVSVYAVAMSAAVPASAISWAA